MRLDKFLCEMNMGSRSQVKEYIKKGRVCVNSKVEKKPEYSLNPDIDQVCLDGTIISYQKYVYFMLNKPAGVVSATEDNLSKTVLSLLSEADFRKDLFPVGRLDKDTTGLLILTNDGELAHRLLSPKRHVEKTYQVGLAGDLSEEDRIRLENGVDIGEKQLTESARCQMISSREVHLTIHEGKFHQVKRMFLAVNNCVCSLKRISFGTIALDPLLKEGEYRPLTDEEVEELRHACNA